MKVKFKRLTEKALVPTKATEHAAGFDLTASKVHYAMEGDIVKYISYGTDIAVEIPEGFVGYLFPRSSVSNKGLSLANSVGVVDADYRGEISLRYYPVSVGDADYNVGERVGQLIIMPIPDVEFVEVKELSDTKRGTGGYGSTGQ